MASPVESINTAESVAPVGIGPSGDTEDNDADSFSGTTWIVRNPKVSDDERARQLRWRKPSGDASRLAEVIPIVIGLVVALGFKSLDRDKYLYYRGVAFGLFCLYFSPDGTFDPARDLRNATIDYYVNHPMTGFSENTKGTHVSALRILGGSPGRNRKSGFTRNAADPYTHAQRNLLWGIARRIESDYSGQPVPAGRGLDTMTMLAAGFGMGLIRGELNYLRADSVTPVSTRSGFKVVVQVSRSAIVRDVPVYGDMAVHLRDRAASLRPDDWLFRPEINSRPNCLNSHLTRICADYPVYDGYTTERARYRLLIDLLTGGAPFHVVAAIAGISAGTKRPTELLPHMPTLTPAQILDEMDRFVRGHDEAAWDVDRTY